jgi:hypothetical protein
VRESQITHEVKGLPGVTVLRGGGRPFDTSGDAL